MSVTGEPGRPPVRVGTSIMDMGAGLWAVIGILSALMRRNATGEGAVVDTSLYETALAWMSYHAATYLASGELPKRLGSGTVGIVPYRAFATADGFVVVGAANDRLFRAFAQVLGHAEWADDPRFRGNPDRVANQETLYPMIEAIMATRSAAEWQAALDAAGVPCAPTQTMDQILAHPQTAALGMLQETADGLLRLMGPPLSFDGMRPPLRRAPPRLGEHTEEILGPFKGRDA
jgi:crotonobetainyl-CoA:carnitine CoA-transferase CaiB-like acyl-CoA transferase